MNKSNINITAIISLILLVFGCSDKTQVEKIESEFTALQSKYKNQLIANKEETKEADSLQTVVYSLEDENKKLKGEKKAYKAISNEEKAVEALVNNLHQG